MGSKRHGYRSISDDVSSIIGCYISCNEAFNEVVLRVGDAWLVGVGKRAPHGFRCPCLASPHGSLDRLKSLYIISSTLNSKRQTKQALGTR